MVNPEDSFEKLMVSLGITRFREMAEHSPLSKTTVGTTLIKGVLLSVITGLEEWVAKASDRGAGRHHSALGKIQSLSPKVVSFIAIKCVLDKMSLTGVGETSTAIALGKEIELEHKLITFRDNYKDTFDKYLNLYRDSAAPYMKRKYMVNAADRINRAFKTWTTEERCVVGMVLLDIVRKSTGIFDVRREKIGKVKTKNVLYPSDECLKWIEDASDQFCMMSPLYLPMIEEPIPWTNNEDGGYFVGMLKKDGLLRTRDSSEWVKDHFNAEECPVVFSAVNAIQSTPWRLNVRVFETFKELWNKGGSIPGVGTFDLLDIPKKPDGLTKEELKQWRFDTSRLHHENSARMGKKIMCSKMVAAMEHLSDKAQFFYPQKMDFRSRVYPVVSFFTPQGHDIAKGALEFAEGKEILSDSEGALWLMVHGANCYGYDKVTFDQRVLWVKEHTAEIVASIEGHTDFWAKADKPFQFLAFCFEYSELVSKGRVESHLPVAMDGSNNGLQIFSLLLRDPVGGKATNCSPSIMPQDIYQTVADKVTARFREENQDWQKDWMELVGPKGFPRKFCKRPVMTLPYGVTSRSAKDYILEWLEETYPSYQGPCRHSIAMLTEYTMDAVREVVPKTIEAMSWMQKCARILAKDGKAITWTTPCGLKLTQRYPKSRSKRIRTTLGDSIKDVTLTESDKVKIDTLKMVNGISPNVIHSLDAAALYFTVDSCLKSGVTSFSMVHDSFATHAVDAPVMAEALRESYASVFSGNYLKELHAGFQSLTEKELPPPPEQGTLDPNDLTHSTYFFL